MQKQGLGTLTSCLQGTDLFVSFVKDPKLLNQNSREKRMVEALGWFIFWLPEPSGLGHLPLPVDGAVARQTGWLACRVAVWGLLLKVIIFLPGTAPRWQLCDPKRAFAVTNKAVKDAPRSKKIHSLKEYDFNDFSVGASLPFKPQALRLSEIPVIPCCVLRRSCKPLSKSPRQSQTLLVPGMEERS